MLSRVVSLNLQAFEIFAYSLGALRPSSFHCIRFLFQPSSSQLLCCFSFFSLTEGGIMAEYSLPDVLERMYQNQLALEAALMELTLHVEVHGHADVGDNVRGALETIGENSGHIKQGLARLKKLP